MRTSPNRMLGLVLGIVYVALGAAGLVASAGVGVFDSAGADLFGVLRTNAAHSVLHLLVGLVLAGAALGGVLRSRPVNIALGALSLLLGMFGLFAVGTDANVLAIDGGDNVLHFASATLLLAVGLGAERAEHPAPSRA